MKRVSTGFMEVLSGNSMYSGIDVHKDSCHGADRTEGEEVFNGCIPASNHSLLNLPERFKDCRIRELAKPAPARATWQLEEH